MLTREQKKEIVKELTDKFSRSKSVIFVDYAGLSVGQITDLRRTLKKNQAELKVAKKTLTDLALKTVNLEASTADFQGQVGLVFNFSADEVTVTQFVYKFALKSGLLKILGGLLDSRFISKDQVVYLAKLSSPQEPLMRLLGCLQSPMRGLINVLRGNLRGLLYVLSNIYKI